jgi:hypothetical protein
MENYIQQIEGTSLIKCSSRKLWRLALIKYLQNLQNIISDSNVFIIETSCKFVTWSRSVLSGFAGNFTGSSITGS